MAGRTAPIEMGSIGPLLAAAIGVFVLAWLAFWSVRLGVAGSASANATRELERMSASSAGGSGDWWKDDLRRVVIDVPKDPTANELLAIATIGSTNDPEQLIAARELLVNAIAQRPGSGYSWASLAAVKYRLGETDAMFESALVNAMKLAPYEPEVQRGIVDYGLAVIDEVKPEARTAIERALAAGMNRNAPEILQISARRGRLGAACRHLDGVPRPAASKWTQLCQSLEPTS
jgi:hypothetical protein